MLRNDDTIYIYIKNLTELILWVLDAFFDHVPQSRIFHGGSYPLLVIDLLVDISFNGMCPFPHTNVQFVPLCKATFQFDSEAESNESGQGTVWYCGGELYLDPRNI